ncbi:MAG TPA: O-antigen ligase family protein [Solirubrobacteraceae bacterium]|nr:O-antigen ligase family protein [Solirubrobacteraceae bacterium]
MSRSHSATASALLAAGLVGVALGARGGNALERTTIVELLAIAVGTAAVCAAIVLAPRGRAHGAAAVAAFAALTAISALSVGWSIAPDISYVEAGRTVAYLAVFAGAVALARLAPDGAVAVARAIVLASVAICAYGLAARVWPASFDELAFTGRIGQPFDYWNALAGLAALGIVPALWLGARRGGSSLGRALAFPASGLLIATLLIAQSRGALAGALVGCALWLTIVPLRLRSVVVLGAAAAGAAPVAAWAVSQDQFSLGLQPLAAREAVAGDFGLMLAALVVVLLAAGIAVEAVGARRQPSLQTRFRAGLAVAVVAALVPLALVTSIATSDRGLTGTISDRLDELTSDSAAPPAGAGRLGSVASERFGYWREALDAFGERPLAGHGAGSFELARLAHRNDGGRARRAHGFGPQTLSDLGLLGGAATLALLAAWLLAAARATGLQPRRRRRAAATARPPWTTERAAAVALALAAVVYGVQSATDWTWFVPGLTMTALLAAGFVAGRGPSIPAAEASTEPRPGVGALLACAAVVALALVCAWSIWQPVRADRAIARGYAALGAGAPIQALREAVEARELDPRSVEPRYVIAVALVDLDRPRAAIVNLRRAAADRRRDPEPWLRIANLEVERRPARALAAAAQALRRDPRSAQAAGLRDRANQLLLERHAATPPASTP